MLEAFTKPLSEYREINEIKESLRRGEAPVQVTGCIDVQKCHFIFSLAEEYKNKVIITHNDYDGRKLYESYKLFDPEVLYFPAKDFIFYQADLQGKELVRERVNVLKKLATGMPVTVITTLDAGMDKRRPLSVFRDNTLRIKEADELDLTKTSALLIRIGYEKTERVEEPGEFSVHGGILDVFPFGEEAPVRIELWGDEIDNIRTFEPASQRSVERVDSVSIFPAMESVYTEEEIEKGIEKLKRESESVAEVFKKSFNTEAAANVKKLFREFKENLEFMYYATNTDSYITSFSKQTEIFFDYFDKADTLFVLDEPSRIYEHGKAVYDEYHDSVIHRLEKGYMLPSQGECIIPFEKALKPVTDKKLVVLSTFLNSHKIKCVKSYDIAAKSIVSYRSDFAELVKDAREYRKNKYRILLVSPSSTRGRRLADNLTEYELPAFFSENKDREIKPGEIMIVKGNLTKGFEYPAIKFVVISESDIFGTSRKERKEKKAPDNKKLVHNNLTDGDYVIHENHGMAIYRGIHKIVADKVTKDYIKLEYAGKGILYVPVTALDLIQKYASSDAKKPKLDTLNSGEWKKTKAKVKTSVNEIATELVELYAKRQSMPGFQFSKDNLWQREFEEMFPYEETKDQLLAIEDTKRDMEKNTIMDRLICGDVGYGKTEIAIRAAFKAVQDSKQVAVLVPTTILCQQHYNTFLSRIGDFPVNVEFLSRFKTAKESKKVIEGLRSGEIDIVIGTHRLLSKDVEFKNLGLLVIDEEQRFGVTHKEKIKQIKNSVDVLTLTATPIPRTMHMSLIGIRDMSVLTEPPARRMPIQTYVMDYNDELVREAIARELARNGQVYYVSNKIAGIEDVAVKIQKLVPDANVVYAHGKMPETKLEKIMMDFINGETDVLVSTTIIETGMDIPNVNTIIIENAERFGLSQLYQLRGRVGRSTRVSYAFLLYKKDKMLKEEAEKRLSAIREFTDLGSGVKIAMKDLEIRGAGNLLGERQSGHMSLVGYELYCKMLNEAIRKLKGQTVTDDEYETSVDVSIDAFIPASYIKNEKTKLDVYREIALVSTREEYNDMVDEIIDRFGEMPESVVNLLDISYLRSLANKMYVTDLKIKNHKLYLYMFKNARLDVEMIPQFINAYNGKMRLLPGKEPVFIYDLDRNMNAAGQIAKTTEIIEDMQSLLEKNTNNNSSDKTVNSVEISEAEK
ncbi:MAG: transcription-repair coupling factor [Clostridiales bacterium]|nr:transcription-repair coupling factor [Clostridiales bacterium]